MNNASNINKPLIKDKHVELKTNDSTKNDQSIEESHVLSIDVECVATGFTHLDRAPCSVAIVNDRCEVIFDSLVQSDKPIVSDLFPFTGVHKKDLLDAPSFEEVIKKVHSFFNPSTLIVGQTVMSDIKWMQLVKGVHYSTVIDLGDEFSTFDPKYRNKKWFSLDHEARVLLKIDLNAHVGHVARDDAKASIQLYNTYIKTKDQSKLCAARKELLRVPTPIPIARRYSGIYERVCQHLIAHCAVVENR